MKFSLSTTAALATAVAIGSTCTSAFAPSTFSSLQRSSSSTKNAAQYNKIFTTSPLHMADSDNDDWSAPKSAMIGGAGVNNAGEPPFEIRGFSLGNLVVTAGVLVTPSMRGVH